MDNTYAYLHVDQRDFFVHAREIRELLRVVREKYRLEIMKKMSEEMKYIDALPRSTTNIPPTLFIPKGLALESFFSDEHVPLPFHHLLYDFCI